MNQTLSPQSTCQLRLWVPAPKQFLMLHRLDLSNTLYNVLNFLISYTTRVEIFWSFCNTPIQKGAWDKSSVWNIPFWSKHLSLIDTSALWRKGLVHEIIVHTKLEIINKRQRDGLQYNNYSINIISWKLTKTQKQLYNHWTEGGLDSELKYNTIVTNILGFVCGTYRL